MLGQVFIVKTDQQSLKLILEQKVGTPAQQKWISKLICYDFHIEYKQGKENKVAYTLSRRFEVEAKEIGCMMISGPSLDWVERLKLSYSIDMHFKHIIEQLNDSPEVVLGVFSLFSMVNGTLLRNGRIYLGQNEEFQKDIMDYIHNSPIGGHSCYEKTLRRAKSEFYWAGMRSDIKKLV